MSHTIPSRRHSRGRSELALMLTEGAKGPAPGPPAMIRRR